jgi:monothiol glutaredoxin
MRSIASVIAALALLSGIANAFAPRSYFGVSSTQAIVASNSPLFMSEDFSADFIQETPEVAQARIQALVDNHPVLLFMKGNKLFPQCGFSNTATQILESYDIDFHTIDVLSDEAIRSGVKDFSQWPTIPQLYVAGEFIGGSDIMIELYQTGELGEMIEKAKADMM